MLRFFIISSQLILLLSITIFLVSNSFNISFDIGDLSYNFSSNLLVVALVILIVLVVLINFIYFKTKFIFQKFSYIKKFERTQKGYDFFVESMIALFNKDNKTAINSARKMRGILKRIKVLICFYSLKYLKLKKNLMN